MKVIGKELMNGGVILIKESQDWDIAEGINLTPDPLIEEALKVEGFVNKWIEELL